MFNEKSIVARTWANAVRKGDRTIEEVPDISNLIAVVNIILEGVEADV